MKTRSTWIHDLTRIVEPVFARLAEDRLRAEMPVETGGNAAEREPYTHLEAVGRSLAGLAPWLNGAGGDAEEAARRESLRALVCRGLTVAVDPGAKDCLNFSNGFQPVVDAAFLAQGLLRSWDAVWCRLPAETQARMVEAMQRSRVVTPYFNNWLLFSAMVEAFLCRAGADWDRMRVDYALRQHEQWYKGDGIYGDGPEFHWDYYNSFVILPMLSDLLELGGEFSSRWAEFRGPVQRRLQRYAAVQERMIAPDGTFPPIGRSLAYRFGALQALALVAWQERLPAEVRPAGVRCAMTAVMRRMLDRPDVFDAAGWLRLGFCGHQPQLAETYISTGSLYLCSVAFLPLGLPPEADFWSQPDTLWTSSRIWAGEDLPCDHALK